MKKKFIIVCLLLIVFVYLSFCNEDTDSNQEKDTQIGNVNENDNSNEKDNLNPDSSESVGDELIKGDPETFEQNEEVNLSDDEFIAKSKVFIDFLKEGQYHEAYDLFDKVIKAAFPPNEIEQLWEKTLIDKYGEFDSVSDANITTAMSGKNKFTIVELTCTTLSSNYYVISLIYNPQALIAGFRYRDIYKAAKYINESLIVEEDYTIENNICSLQAVLTLPKGVGKFPAVILVHGSGPNDMDETIGPNKPFKDLAWGLANQGIAVLRYNKRTKQCPDYYIENIKNLTLNDITVDDALESVKLLKKNQLIDHNKIFVLGHSLGGLAAPRIASKDNSISGIIIMAGNSRNLLDIIIEQYNYIFNLDGDLTDEEKKQIEAIKEQVNKIKNGTMPESEVFLLGGKPFWDDLLEYNQVETAKKLNIPILVLQGGRDYQITIDDFEKWKQNLTEGNATFKLYDDLNHLFLYGEGKSSPEEYNNYSNIPEEVIKDISQWIKSQ